MPEQISTVTPCCEVTTDSFGDVVYHHSSRGVTVIHRREGVKLDMLAYDGDLSTEEKTDSF